MTRFALIIASGLLSLFGTALAAETVTAVTTGMTCEECAGTVKTKLLKNDAVENVSVDVDTGTVVVTVKDGATFSDADMEEVVAWAGYDVVTLTRAEG